jgi:hypothetical protein
MIRNIMQSMVADSVFKTVWHACRALLEIQCVSTRFVCASLRFFGAASKLFLLLTFKGRALGC